MYYVYERQFWTQHQDLFDLQWCICVTSTAEYLHPKLIRYIYDIYQVESEESKIESAPTILNSTPAPLWLAKVHLCAALQDTHNPTSLSVRQLLAQLWCSDSKRCICAQHCRAPTIPNQIRCTYDIHQICFVIHGFNRRGTVLDVALFLYGQLGHRRRAETQKVV